MCLWHPSNGAGALAQRPAGDVVTIEGDPTGLRGEKSQDGTKQRRLATPVWPQDADDGPSLDGEAHDSADALFAIAEGEVVNGEHFT